MNLTSLTRTTAFRIASLVAGLFAFTIVIIFSVLYIFMSNDLMQTSRDHVDEISGTLVALDDANGRDALISMVGRHTAVSQTEEDIYLITDRNGNFVAGNIRSIPKFEGWRTIPWIELPLIGDWGDKRNSTAVIGRWSDVRDGFLFVGDGNGSINDAQDILLDGLGWGLVMAGVSGALGGLLIGWRTQRRVSALESALNSVARGELGTRVPRTSSSDDLEHVAALINETVDRLQRLIAEVEQVTTDIAHDLKTPIGRIRQKLELALSGPPHVETFSVTINDALKDIDDVTETFEALLRIAEIEAGSRRSKFTDVDLGAVLTVVADALRPVAEDGGQRFELSLAPQQTCTVKGDRQLLNQLFVNLVENAIRHCPRGALVKVGLASSSDGILATVADNGPGIPAAERERVFRRLYRLEKSRTTPGNGLGLSLVEAIANLHGASVSLSDNQPGLIATIRFAKPG